MFINNFINRYGDTILYTIIMAIISYLGITIKRLITIIYQNREKKEVIEITCKATEQLYSNLTNEEKLNKTITNASLMLKEKGIAITNLELRMLIESTINTFNINKNKSNHKTPI